MHSTVSMGTYYSGATIEHHHRAAAAAADSVDLQELWLVTGTGFIESHSSSPNGNRSAHQLIRFVELVYTRLISKAPFWPGSKGNIE